MDKHWFVFYTKSRQEKKVASLLEKNGFEVFLPLQKIMRQWSDRKKKVEVPLFNSYIFVRETEPNLLKVLQIPGIAWAVKHNEKPATLRQVEIDTIHRFIESGLTIETESLSQEFFQSGDQAVVLDGPLSGIKGTLTGESGHGKFTVLLESINQVLRVQIHQNLLRKV